MEAFGCCAIIFVFVAAMVGVGIYFSVVTAQKANACWQAVAGELRLRYIPGAMFRGRMLQGWYRGQWIKVDLYHTGGKNSQTYTRYEVQYPEPLGLGLRLHRQGFWSNVWQALGGHDITIGDEVFDAAVVVKGRDPDAVAAFLTRERKDLVYDLLHDLSGCMIDDNRVKAQVLGLETKPDRMIRTIRRMCEVAGALSRFVDDEEEPLEPPSGRLSDESIPVVRPVHPRPEKSPEAVTVRPYYQGLPPPLPARSSENVMAEPPYGETAPLSAPLAEEVTPPAEATTPPYIPLAEEVAPSNIPLAEAVNQPAVRDDLPIPTAAVPPIMEFAEPPPIAAADTPAPVAPAPATSQSGLSAAEVCDHLFGGDKMTHRITEQFDQDYKDRSICWSGLLQEVSAFFFEMQFSNATGTRAAFEIHEVVGLFGSNKVQAVVQLPAGLDSALRDRTGERLTFTGRLVGCDAFLRRLFVADGQLV